MKMQIPVDLLNQIHAHGETAYPEEGAGFLLGREDGETRRLISILSVENSREDGARNNRYLLTPEELGRAEDTAQRLGLMLLGVFHSHPDHPAQPSEFDRDWALPWFSYLITSVNQGKAELTRAWRLSEDRSQFNEEEISTEAVIQENKESQ
jgi:proteasome lid subunit RPN8/RPN11